MRFTDLFSAGTALPDAGHALPGRAEPVVVSGVHAVLGTPMLPPFPAGMAEAQFALGCFWGAEQRFWQVPGVFTTAVGYTGGHTPNPTYREVCTGRTGHAETVRVVFDPRQVGYQELLRVFWESHDPTQGMRQGNDVGSQYRSAIFFLDQVQRDLAVESARVYQELLTAAGYGPVTTQIAAAGPFYYAEEYHQQYLAKVPDGYCGLQGTGVACPVGVVRARPQR